MGGIIVRQEEEEERTRGFAFASALLPFRILFVNHKGLLIDGVGFRRRARGSKSMPMASPLLFALYILHPLLGKGGESSPVELWSKVPPPASSYSSSSPSRDKNVTRSRASDQCIKSALELYFIFITATSTHPLSVGESE